MMDDEHETPLIPSVSEREVGAPLGEVLGRVAVELAQLGEAMGRFQGALSPLLVGCDERIGFGDAASLRDIQTIDHVSQTLDCLADFLARVAVQLPVNWRMDSESALQAVKLAALSSKLRPHQEEPAGSLSIPGECELF